MGGVFVGMNLAPGMSRACASTVFGPTSLNSPVVESTGTLILGVSAPAS